MPLKQAGEGQTDVGRWISNIPRPASDMHTYFHWLPHHKKQTPGVNRGSVPLSPRTSSSQMATVSPILPICVSTMLAGGDADGGGGAPTLVVALGSEDIQVGAHLVLLLERIGHAVSVYFSKGLSTKHILQHAPSSKNCASGVPYCAAANMNVPKIVFNATCQIGNQDTTLTVLMLVALAPP